MKTAYVIRHRVAGHVSTHVYLNPPTETQIAERKAQADYHHGDPGNRGNWVTVEEIKLVEGEELDPFVPPSRTMNMAHEVQPIRLEMTGLVGRAADEYLAKTEMAIGSADVATVKAEDLVKPPTDRKTKR